MVKVFIDTNVFIDYIACREDFYQPAATIVALAYKKKISLLVSSLSFATGSYLLEIHYRKSPAEIRASYKRLCALCEITAIDSQSVAQSITSPFEDFEDSMQYYSATTAQADYIITRDKSGFKHSAIPVYKPQEFLEMLLAQ